MVKNNFNYSVFNKLNEIKFNKSNIAILNIGNNQISVGKPTKISGLNSYESIEIAIDLCKRKIAKAMVTAPISKTAFNMASIKFPGHTELLANRTKTKNFIMTFLSKKMKGGLLTIHEPIKNVPKLIKKEKLSNSTELILKMFNNDFGIKNPKIAVLGLNPHAGESGIIGKEEEEIITPIIKKYPKNLFGPFSSDAFFANHLYKNFDFVLGMYHDQLLIPFKMMNFNSGVNYTAGLPIIRTSPDHGTAFDIAYKGIANSSSFLEAFYYAEKISSNKK